eukprot:sb/3478348/
MLPALLSVSANKEFLPQWACTLTSFIDTATLPLSLWILSASSLDRCVMIYKPIKYKYELGDGCTICVSLFSLYHYGGTMSLYVTCKRECNYLRSCTLATTR